MGKYIKEFNNLESKKIKKITKDLCYIHLSIFEKVLKFLIKDGYTILGWEAIIYTIKGTLSPIELIIGTGPETDKCARNNNALNRDYKYFTDLIDKRIDTLEYKKEDIYIDLSFK